MHTLYLIFAATIATRINYVWAMRYTPREQEEGIRNRHLRGGGSGKIEGAVPSIELLKLTEIELALLL